TSLVCIYKNPFEKTASVEGMGRKLPRNFRKAKPKTCRVIVSGTPLGSAASKSAALPRKCSHRPVAGLFFVLLVCEGKTAHRAVATPARHALPGQLLERPIVLELRDVLDRCDGDVQ